MSKRSVRETRHLERQLKAARAAGRLVAAHEQAWHAGLDCRCEVDVSLWNSLFWKYPSARRQDIVDLTWVLEELCCQLKSDAPFQATELFVQLPQVPWWIEGRLSVKCVLLYEDGKLGSIIMLPNQGTMETIVSLYEPPPPATLILKLMLACRRLQLVVSGDEQTAATILRDTIDGFIRFSPLHAQIRKSFTQLAPAKVPAEYAYQEYRQLVCRDLFHLLDLVSSVTKTTGSDFRMPVTSVLQLLAQQVGTMPTEGVSAAAEQSQLLH